MDPSLKDLKAEIEYEIKISEKNQKDKMLKEQLESENLIFDWEAGAIDMDQGACCLIQSDSVLIASIIAKLMIVVHQRKEN